MSTDFMQVVNRFGHQSIRWSCARERYEKIDRDKRMIEREEERDRDKERLNKLINR